MKKGKKEMGFWKNIDDGLYSMFMSKEEYITRVADEIIRDPWAYATEDDDINETSVEAACNVLDIPYSEFSLRDLEKIMDLVREGL